MLGFLSESGCFLRQYAMPRAHTGMSRSVSKHQNTCTPTQPLISEISGLERLKMRSRKPDFQKLVPQTRVC